MQTEELFSLAARTPFANEAQAYAFLVAEILNTPVLSLLPVKDKLKQKADEIQNQRHPSHAKSHLWISILPELETELNRHAQLMNCQKENKSALLLSALKLLEGSPDDGLYPETLKYILTHNLHKLEVAPLKITFVGRKKELATLNRVLDRGERNHVLIAGSGGVGKTTLARQMIGKRPQTIIYQLQPGSVNKDDIVTLTAQAGGKRLLFFLDEIFTFEPEIISYLVKNSHVLATSNDRELGKFSSEFPELISKFEVVILHSPRPEEVGEIVANHQKYLKNFYQVSWEDGVADEVYSLAKRYSEQQFPAKAITLIEEAALYARSLGFDRVSRESIKAIISQKTDIPIGELTEFDRKDLSQLPEKIKSRIRGQDGAVDRVVRVIQRSRLGFGKRRGPIGTFLFIGPSGVGKTELAKTLAQTVFGSEEEIVRLDMSEFAEAHNVQRLVGAPPGYVGFEEGGQLTNPVRARPYNLVLLDEIEKAHPRVFDIFLQVFDDGRLTDGQGKMVDFRNTVIIATSNAATEDIMDLIAEKKSRAEIEAEVEEILPDYFRIEFINRFDAIVVFNSLDIETLEQIAVLELGKLKSILGLQKIDFSVSQETISRLARESYDPRYGARELLRRLKDTIENKLVEMIMNGELKANQRIEF